MRRMAWAPVVLVLLLMCGTAWAAPATVNLRVEGATQTIFEGPVTTDGREIDGKDGTGFHKCDGTNFGAHPTPGPTMTSALDDAERSGALTWAGTWFPSFEDFVVGAVNSEQGSGASYWGTVLNFSPTPAGGCQTRVADGDQALFALGDVYGQKLLRLGGATQATTGQPVTLDVTNGPDGQPVAGATIAGVSGETGADGKLPASFDSPGVKTLKAQAPGAIRSNAWQVCVEAPGSGTCTGFTSPLVQPAAQVKDSAAPQARISGPRNGRRYRRGPGILTGTASDEGSGLREVSLALRRHVRGKGCRWWSARRERFVGRNCRKKVFFAIGDDAKWSYQLPRPLGPGHYVVDVKVTDVAGNRAESFRRGANRTVFDVVGKKREHEVRATAAPPRVAVMVVGMKQVLAEPANVRARALVVRASGRRCAVAASTPLAALVAALRRENVRYSLRDFGACRRGSARSSRQLFVTRIGKERNSGQDGWVYKVNDLAPSRGAADGRLRAGDRLAWLYCEQDLETGGCQRSLRAVPAKKTGLAGQSLTVRVFGYDDKRDRVPVTGARVTLTADNKEVTSAVTAADGSALLTLPGAGRYQLTATAAGLVPSFPVTIRTK